MVETGCQKRIKHVTKYVGLTHLRIDMTTCLTLKAIKNLITLFDII